MESSTTHISPAEGPTIRQVIGFYIFKQILLCFWLTVQSVCPSISDASYIYPSAKAATR